MNIKVNCTKDNADDDYKLRIEAWDEDHHPTIIEGNFHRSEIHHMIQYLDKKTGTGL